MLCRSVQLHPWITPTFLFLVQICDVLPVNSLETINPSKLTDISLMAGCRICLHFAQGAPTAQSSQSFISRSCLRSLNSVGAFILFFLASLIGYLLLNVSTCSTYHTPGGALLMEIIRQVTGNVKEQQVCELQRKVFDRVGV